MYRRRIKVTLQISPEPLLLYAFKSHLTTPPPPPTHTPSVSSPSFQHKHTLMCAHTFFSLQQNMNGGGADEWRKQEGTENVEFLSKMTHIISQSPSLFLAWLSVIPSGQTSRLASSFLSCLCLSVFLSCRAPKP